MCWGDNQVTLHLKLKKHPLNNISVCTYLEVLQTTRESFLGTEGAFLELLINLLTQFLTPSKDVNSLSGRRDQGFELFMSSTATASALPTCNLTVRKHKGFLSTVPDTLL